MMAITQRIGPLASLDRLFDPPLTADCYLVNSKKHYVSPATATRLKVCIVVEFSIEFNGTIDFIVIRHADTDLFQFLGEGLTNSNVTRGDSIEIKLMIGG